MRPPGLQPEKGVYRWLRPPPGGLATGNARAPYRAKKRTYSAFFRSPSLPKLSQDAVDTALAHWLSTAAATGRPSLDISEGALHARVGSTQQQPACCDAMRKLFDKAIDTLLSGPATGYSSALCIRYKLPRP